MNRAQSSVRRRALSAARTVLVLAIGFVTVQVVLHGAILLVMPGLFRDADFPVGGALVALLLIEILAGAAGVFVAAMLSGRAVAGHGWALGLIIMAFNLWVVTAPDSPWPLVPAVVVVAFVPLQTWAAVAVARRLRRRRRSHRVAAGGAGAAESASVLLIALIACGLLAAPRSAAASLSGGYADEGPTPASSWHPVDTVHVAPPTGAAETDRANVQAAFDAVRPGGTILFASGTYMLGAGARLTVPDVTVLGHPEGTVLRGCDAEAFGIDYAEIEKVVFGCTGLYVQAERQTIRGLTFEYTWHGIVVGPYPTSAEEAATFWESDERPAAYPAGGHRIEGNTFRLTPNGLRVLGTGTERSVVRDNDFVDVFHAIGIYGAPLHFLDNRVTVAEPERVPFSRHPGSAIIVSPVHTDCSGHVVAGNRVVGYPDPIYVLVRRGETCRSVEIRDNTIHAARVKVPEAWGGYEPTERDSTMVGTPITLMSRTEPVPETPDTEPEGILEDILVQGNRIVGADGLGIIAQGLSRSRIADNTIMGIRRRAPFRGLTWDGYEHRWEEANGSAIWVSAGSDGNEIIGNRFDDIAGAAIVLEGDSNRVSLQGAGDAVRDLGSGNRIEGLPARQRHPAAADSSPSYPVHDVETFFDTENVFPALWDRGVFSHDERRVLVASDRTGTFNAFAIPVEGGQPEQLTRAVDGSVLPISWFPQDDRFLYEEDEGGNERSALRVRELDGSATELTPAEDVRAEFLGWSADGTAFWVATDERVRPVMDVYRYSSADYERAMIFRNDGGYLVAGISATGRWTALQRTNSNTDTDLYLHDLETGEIIPMSPDVEGVRHRFMDFSADGDVAFYGTDQFGEFQEVWQYQTSTGERSAVERADWDVRRLRISSAGSYRIAQITEDASPAIRVTHVKTGDRLAFPQLPVGEVGRVAFSPKETKLLLMAQGPRSPGDLYVLDLANLRAPPRQLTRVLSPAIDPADLVEAEPVRFASSDGVEIPGILYQPRQASHEQRVPALVYLHGGPGGISTRTWDERLQHLVNQGYAVLDVNYRGSEGYGKTFLTLDDRRHGEADVQDVLAARDWLAGLDWVDADRIGLMGDSFGGFLTLATLALHPESFAVGIAGHPSINWISTLTIARDRLGPAVEAQYAEIGHPERDAERLRRISPYFHADQVVKPVLIYHGANDPRYDLSEVDEFVAAIRSNGVPVEYMLFQNEGHYLVNLENRIAAQEAWLAFLGRYLR